MSRRRKGRDISGIVLLDKPAGYSSNQAVQKVRWLFQARKAGHTGALDPFATGMLPICLGEASKTAGFMLDADKSYEATAVLGRATATGDTEGETVRDEKVPDLSAGDIDAALARFTGSLILTTTSGYDHVDLDAAAGGAGDDAGVTGAQAQRLEHVVGGGDLVDGVVGQADAHRIAITKITRSLCLDRHRLTQVKIRDSRRIAVDDDAARPLHVDVGNLRMF